MRVGAEMQKVLELEWFGGFMEHSERCVYYCSGTYLGLLVVCSWDS